MSSPAAAPTASTTPPPAPTAPPVQTTSAAPTDTGPAVFGDAAEPVPMDGPMGQGMASDGEGMGNMAGMGAPPVVDTRPAPPAPVEPMKPANPLPGNDPVPSAGCGNASSPGSGSSFSMDVEGMRRTYIVAAPLVYDANKPHKLVFAWHYLGGSASGIALGGYYGLQAQGGADTIFVTAEGLDGVVGKGWSNANDIPFAANLLEWMKSNYCVDETRVFSVGFSFGAIMSNRVGCKLGDQFRAIAPMSGGTVPSGCKGTVAAWISHGRSDATLDFSGGEKARDRWAASNHCGSETVPVGSCVAYQGCDEGYPVHWCEFAGGHVQPPGASQAIWAFFSQF